MAKKRGFDMKLYRLAALLTAAITDTPAVGSWLIINTVNKVTRSYKGNETTVETRETEDDYVLASGRTSEFDVLIPYDLADAHFVALLKASNSQAEIALAFAANALTTSGADNEVHAANFVITEESRDESKKEAVIVTFKCKPSSFSARIIKP